MASVWYKLETKRRFMSLQCIIYGWVLAFLLCNESDGSLCDQQLVLSTARLFSVMFLYYHVLLYCPSLCTALTTFNFTSQLIFYPLLHLLHIQVSCLLTLKRENASKSQTFCPYTVSLLWLRYGHFENCSLVVPRVWSPRRGIVRSLLWIALSPASGDSMRSPVPMTSSQGCGSDLSPPSH